MSNNENSNSRNNTWIGNRQPGIKPGLKDAVYMSRREFMDFATWLKFNVTEEEFPPVMTTILTNRGSEDIDVNEDERRALKHIKQLWLPGLYQGVSVVLRHYFDRNPEASRRDCESLFEIPIFYEEDLYAALILYGLDEKRAREFASMSARGAYKAYSRSVDSLSRISMIHDDFEDFCRAAGGLPNRRMLTRIFPEQYERFLSETKQKKA